MATLQIRGTWYLALHDEGQVLLRSIEIDQPARCTEVVDAIRRLGSRVDHYERRAATNGGYYFLLRDEAWNVIARSPTFDTMATCERMLAKVCLLVRAGIVIREVVEPRAAPDEPDVRRERP